MVKKIMLIFAIAMLSATYMFAGEFSWGNFRNFLVQKNYSEAKKYFESNKDFSYQGDLKVRYKSHYYIANFCVAGPLCDKKITSVEQLSTEIAKVVANDSTLSANEKIVLELLLRCHSPWWAGFDRWNDSYHNDMKTFLYQEKTQKWLISTENKPYLNDIYLSFWRIREKDNALKYALMLGDGFRSVSLAIDLMDYTKIIESLNLLADNPLTIYRASDLNSIVGKFSKLTNPKYDEALKSCMIALNRAFYPNIGKSDEWKNAVVALQLKMKVYGIATN